MVLKISNFLRVLTTNALILLFSFILIQNANSKTSLNFLKFKSAEMPVGLVISLSFIAGSSLGSTILILSRDDKILLK